MSTANYVYYDTTSGSFEETTALTVTAINSGSLPTSWSDGYYVVGADYNGDGVINAADATYAAEKGLTTAFTISSTVTYTGDVHLILADGFSLTVSKGINTTTASSDITIYGQQNNTGSLTATGKVGIPSTAGIGSSQKCGDITIHGGTITATGGGKLISYAPGIGCQSSYGTITIYGGNVTATSGGSESGGLGGGSGSGIYVNDTSTLKAGTTASPTTVIDHTLTANVASSLSGKQYVTITSPDPVLTDYTLLLSGGTAYKNSVAAENVVTVSGLSYADGIWMMNGVNFTTKAATAVEIADTVTLSVTGTNTITGGSGDTNTYGLKFDNAASVTGSGTLTITAGTGTNSYGVYAVSQPAALAKYNDTVLVFEDNTYKLATGGDIAQTVTLTEPPPDYTIVLDSGIAYKSMDGGETLGEVIAVSGLSYADGIWTMNGVNFTTTATTAMKINDAVVISVTGTNTITGGNGDTNTYGLKFADTSTILGSGTLTVTAGTGTNSYGVYAYYRKPDAEAKNGETTLTFADNTYKNGDAIASTVSLTAADKNYGIFLYNGKAYSDKAHSVEITDTVNALGLSFDAGSNTWTMENFNFVSSNTQTILSSGNVVAALIIDSETTITVTGSNTVATSDITSLGFATEGIRINAHTLMNGDGTLNVIAGNAPSTSVGISYGYADLAVTGNVTLNAYGGTSGSWISAGIYDYNTGYLLAKDNAKVYACSASKGDTTYGVTLEKPITVLGNASITAVAIGTTTNENAGVKVIAGTPAATAKDDSDVPLTWNATKLGDSTGTYVYSDNSIASYVVMTAGVADYTIYCTVDGKVYSDSGHTLDITHLVSVMGLSYNADHWEMSDFTFTTTAATALKFEDATIVTVSGTNTIGSIYNGSESSSGLLFAGNAVVNGTGSLTITGGTSTTSNYGLNAEALQLADTLTLTATGTTGGYYGSSAITTDGTTAAAIYDADGNTLTWANNTYNYNSTPATTVTNYCAPVVSSLTGTSNIQPMYSASGMTFTVGGTTVTKAKEGDAVTVSGKDVDQFEVVGYTSNDVEISGNSFTMPDQDVTVKAQYRFDVANGKTLTLVSGTYTNELGFDGNGGMGSVQEGGTLIANNVTFSGNTAANKGGAIYSDGTIILSNVTFTGNAGNGGAIYNEGTVTLTGVVTLSSETDTFVNDDSVNWDLTGGTASYGKLNGYQYFTNNAHLTITVNNDQAEGEYTIATGVTDVTGKDEFTLTGTAGMQTITVGDSNINYGGRYYALKQLNTNLVLTVSEEVPPVKYMDYSISQKQYLEKTCTDYTILTGSETALTDGWYVVSNTTTAFSSTVSISGDVHIIVKDGTALTVDSFAVNSGATLNLYGQSGFTGNVTSTNGFSGTGDVKAQIDVTAIGNLTTGTTDFTPGKYLFGANGTFTSGSTLNTDRVFAGKKITTAGEHNVATSMTVVSSSVNAHRIVSGACVSVAGDVTLMGGSSLTISNNNVFSDEYVICGSQAITGSRVTQDGSNTIEISGGTYTGMVCGAGFVGHKDSSYNLTGNVTMTISGGTFSKILLGGVGVTHSSYAKDSIVGGNINMTFDCSSNQITLNCVYGGCGGEASLNGNVTMTFKGNGANLDFVGKNSGVSGGNVVNSGAVNGNATLLFNEFDGVFNAQAISNFNAIDFDKGSAVTFEDFGGTETGEHVAKLNTSTVKVWDFATGTNLDFQRGTNSFSGDDLIFGDDGGSITSDWVVIDSGSDDIFAGLATANSVTLFGEEAEYNKIDSVWASDTYKLSIDNHDLVVSKLA